MSIKLAKEILIENSNVLYGIFGVVESSGYFPTHDLLNLFLMLGSDPCDQDGRMKSWRPFTFNAGEYSGILSWWKESHPTTQVLDFSAKTWAEWSYELIERS